MPIQIIDTLAPKNNGAFPTHDSQYGKGGWHQVETDSDRDAIPVDRRVAGMACHVTSTGITYLLSDDLVTWDYKEPPIEGTVSNVIYVDVVGNDNNDGSYGSPVKTIYRAIELSTNTTLIQLSAGEFIEQLELGTKDVCIVGYQGNSEYATTKISGSTKITGSKKLLLVGVELNNDYGDISEPILDIADVSGNVVFKRTSIKSASTQNALTISPLGTAYTGSVKFVDCSIPAGRLTLGIGTGRVEFVDTFLTKNVTIDMLAGDVSINNVPDIGQIIHRTGRLFISNVESLGNSTTEPAILSVAPDSERNLLGLNNVSTWNRDRTAQSYIDKTGGCDYYLNGFTRNVAEDEFSGTQITRLSNQYDLDIISTYDADNYNAAQGDTLRAHLIAIDTALATSGTVFKLINASTSGQSLIADQSGILYTLSGTDGISVTESLGQIKIGTDIVGDDGIDVEIENDRVKIINTGTLSLQGLTGEISLVGDGIDISADVDTITLKAVGGSGTAGVSTVSGLTGDVVITGSGVANVTVDSNGNAINVSVPTPVKSINAAAGDVTLVPGPGISITQSPVQPQQIEISSEQGTALQQVSAALYTGTFPNFNLVANNGTITKTATIKQLIGGYNVNISEEDGGIRFDVISGSGTVKSVNNIVPTDIGIGNVELTSADVGAISKYGDVVEGSLNMSNNTITGLGQATNLNDALTVASLNNGLFSIDQGVF